MLDNPLIIANGLIAGTSSLDGKCRIYKGIPFAAPPVGPLRWCAPRPVQPWNGVLKADRFGPVCLQPHHVPDGIMSQFSFGEPPESGMSEDCLYLNVWTAAPSASARLPVIVWLYGGGHLYGGSSHPVSSGEQLAKNGAIVVSLNYRLGAFGYLAHPELTREAGTSGNYASMDILAALEWIKTNIATFGGDPECVTLFGQSAGAAHVNVLMASLRAKGLFHRAIAHSSGRFNGGAMGAPMKRLRSAEAAGAEWLEKLGARTLNELRDLPSAALVGGRGLWNIIIDGNILTESVQDVFAEGKQMKIPLLTGYTRDEGSAYATPELQTRASFIAHAKASYGTSANKFLALYPHDDDRQAIISSYALKRDPAFAYQPWKFARMQSATGAVPIYLFNFLRAVPLPPDLRFSEPMPPNGYGAYHGAELWYVFHSFSAKKWNWSTRDHEIADTVGKYWINFCRTGNPNGLGLSTWQEFSASGNALHIDEEIISAPPFNRAALEFFDAWFDSL